MFMRELFLGLLAGGILVWIFNLRWFLGHRANLDRFTKQLADREGEINRLRALGTVDVEAARLAADLTASQSKIERLELALREAAERPDMSATIALLKQERDDAIAALSSRPEKAEAPISPEELDRLRATEQHSQVRIASLEAELTKLRAAPAFPSPNPEIIEALDHERAQVAALKAELESLRPVAQEVERARQELIRVAGLEPAWEQERAQFALARSAAEEAEEARVAAIQAELDSARTRVATLEEQANRAQAQQRDLELQIAKVDEQAREIEGLQGDLVAARVHISQYPPDLQDRLDASQREVELLVGESNFLKSELQRLRTSADALESTRLELESAQSELSILRKANQDLQNEVRESRSGRHYEKEIQSLRSQLAAARICAVEPEDGAALRQRVTALGQEVATLTNSLANAYAVIEGLREKLRAMDREEFTRTIGVTEEMQNRLHNAGILHIDDLLNAPSSRLLDILGWNDSRLNEVEHWQRTVRSQRA